MCLLDQILDIPNMGDLDANNEDKDNGINLVDNFNDWEADVSDSQDGYDGDQLFADAGAISCDDGVHYYQEYVGHFHGEDDLAFED